MSLPLSSSKREMMKTSCSQPQADTGRQALLLREVFIC